jgi:hypothetical protein
MQQARFHSFSHSWRPLAVFLTALVVAPATVRAQQVSGALSVALTVLPPVRTQAVELLEFRVDRDGTARLETTAPAASSVSLLVMATVASSGDESRAVAQAPVLVEGTPDGHSLGALPASTTAPTPRLSYQVDLGRLPAGSGSREATLRISYLVVAGT